jgi:hypothetical protein
LKKAGFYPCAIQWIEGNIVADPLQVSCEFKARERIAKELDLIVIFCIRCVPSA